MANEFKHVSVGTEITQAEYEGTAGHVFNSQATGDIMYASSSSQLTRLGIGSTGAVLTVTGGVPAWDTTWTPTGHLIPATDDSYDLGSASAAWQDLFLEGDITLTDAGTIATSAGALTITSAAAATWSTSAGALTIDGDDGITLQTTGSGNVTVAEILDITDSTDSSDASGDTGALRTEGGASIAKKLYVGTDLDVDGTTNLDAVDIDGAIQIDNTITVGADDQGYDIIFYGDAASANMTWDTSVDDLILNGAARIVIPDGQLVLGSTAVGSTAAELNLLDGSAKSTSSITLADSDAFIVIDGTTTKQIPASDLSAYVTAEGAMSSFQLEDDDGTEVTINNANEIKFIGSGITTNWTDTDNGTDGDPYDMTFTVDAAQTGITSIYATDLIMGEDSQTAIDFGTANEIDFKADNAARLTLTSGALYPVTNNEIDLGTSSLEFKDAFFDGTVTAVAFAGPLTGNVTGNASGTAATVTTAAQSNITSLGTLTTLTVDNVIVNGTTIGHTSDTDLLTLTSANLAVAGDIEVSGSVEVATIDYTDGDNALTIADGGGVTFAQDTTFSGIIDITDATDSSDASGDTGALRTEGGASIAKKLYVGTDLDVDGTAELDNITIGGAQGSDGQVLTSTGSAVAWEDAASGGGITQASTWLMTSDFDPSSDGTITANLSEKSSAAGRWGKIGSSMTESSGIFTFPATGIWMVTWGISIYGSGNDTVCLFTIQTSNDGFSSDSNDTGRILLAKSANEELSGYASIIMDVTNTSNDQVRFRQENVAANITIAGAVNNNTWFEFVRLGDT